MLTWNDLTKASLVDWDLRPGPTPDIEFIDVLFLSIGVVVQTQAIVVTDEDEWERLLKPALAIGNEVSTYEGYFATTIAIAVQDAIGAISAHQRMALAAHVAMIAEVG